jgi:DNA-binding beta-propeller fold protein YncE
MSGASGSLDYEVVAGWQKLPEGWSFVDVPSVAADSHDNVYVLNRGEYPVIVFDGDGAFLGAWGKGVFARPHGIFIDSDDMVYCTDSSDHTVRIFEPGGRLVQTLGEVNKPQDTGYKEPGGLVKTAAGPFNGVTNVAKAPSGDLYVADGYGNARVHVFDEKRLLKFSWGEPGTGPGQFRLPHAIAVDRAGKIYVADRENSRIQIFTGHGDYLAEWTHLHRPDDLYIDSDENLYVAELGFKAAVMPHPQGATPPPHEPHARVSVLTLDGQVQTQFGGSNGCEAGGFFAPHGICVDSRGDVYVGEVNFAAGVKRGLLPLDCHVLQKFRRLKS